MSNNFLQNAPPSAFDFFSRQFSPARRELSPPEQAPALSFPHFAHVCGVFIQITAVVPFWPSSVALPGS